jgi:hypothetical protein
MEYVLDAILIIVALAFLIGGVGRGPLAELLTLGAILLGALLMAEWGALWGTDVAELFNLGDVSLTRFVVGVLLLVAPVAIIGYGGAWLLPRLQPMRWWHRMLGGLLGLANGVALGALALRHWYNINLESNPGGLGPLLADPITLFYLNWAGWWPLALLAVGIGAVIVGLLTGAFRPQKAPGPRPAPPAPTPAAPAPETRPAPLPASPRPAAPEPVLTTAPAPLPSRPAPIPAERPTAVTPVPAPPPAAPAARPEPPRAGDGASPRPGPASAAPGTVKRCLTCGKVLAPGAAFCPNCGTPVEA